MGVVGSDVESSHIVITRDDNATQAAPSVLVIPDIDDTSDGPDVQRRTRTGLATAGLLSAIAAIRIADFDAPATIAITAVAPWLLLPAYGLLAVALRQRARPLTAVAMALVALQLVWAGPLLPSQPATTAAVADLRVLTANLSMSNTMLGEVAAWLVASEADVLFLQEITPRHLDELDEQLRIRYPHAVVHPEEGYFGGAIYSRLPLHQSDVAEVGETPMPVATIEVAGTRLRLASVHVPAPLNGPLIKSWRATLSGMRSHGGLQEALLVGDFNATPQHAPFRELLRSGWRSAHRDVGRGYAATFPAGRLLPAVVGIDHVLLPAAWSATQVAEIEIPGSDHRGVMASLSYQGETATAAPT